jgi:hypothetical protein
MLTTLKVTKIWIEHIKEIEAEEPKTFEGFNHSQRSLMIWTTEGERYELYFQAGTLEALYFKKPDDSWLNPKVYKGSKEDESSSDL